MNKSVIIIPTYNERRNIPLLLPKIFQTIPEIDVMVTDDNSPDGTGNLVEELKKIYPRLFLFRRASKEGLGKAYIDSSKKILRMGEYETVVMMDGDMSHDPKYLPEILRLAETHDLVIGSRYITGSGITKKWGLLRRVLSAGGNIYLRILFSFSIHDWTTGFNAISARALAKMDFTLLSPKGYAFISSLKYYLLKQKASCVETPIFFEERRGGESKMSWPIIREGLTAPWKIRARGFFQESWENS